MLEKFDHIKEQRIKEHFDESDGDWEYANSPNFSTPPLPGQMCSVAQPPGGEKVNFCLMVPGNYPRSTFKNGFHQGLMYSLPLLTKEAIGKIMNYIYHFYPEGDIVTEFDKNHKRDSMEDYYFGNDSWEIRERNEELIRFIYDNTLTFSELIKDAKDFHEKVLGIKLPKSVKDSLIVDAESLTEYISRAHFLSPNTISGPAVCATLKIAIGKKIIEEYGYDIRNIGEKFAEEILQALNVDEEKIERYDLSKAPIAKDCKEEINEVGFSEKINAFGFLEEIIRYKIHNLDDLKSKNKNALESMQKQMASLKEFANKDGNPPTTKTYESQINFGGKNIKIKIIKRIKSEERILLKYLRHPHLNPDRINDFCGLIIECNSREEVALVISHTCKHLSQQEHTKSITVKNRNLLEDDELLNLEMEKIELKLDEDNAQTDSNFQAAYIQGKYNTINKKGDKLEPTFEIQFVIKDNKNDEGFSNHKVYEVKQLLATLCGLYGYITENHLNKTLRELEQSSGIAFEELKDHFLNKNLEETSKKGAKTKTYCTLEHLDLMDDLNMIPQIREPGYEKIIKISKSEYAKWFFQQTDQYPQKNIKEFARSILQKKSPFGEFVLSKIMSKGKIKKVVNGKFEETEDRMEFITKNRLKILHLLYLSESFNLSNNFNKKEFNIDDLVTAMNLLELDLSLLNIARKSNKKNMSQFLTNIKQRNAEQFAKLKKFSARMTQLKTKNT